jgi:hypothetical protein
MADDPTTIEGLTPKDRMKNIAAVSIPDPYYRQFLDVLEEHDLEMVRLREIERCATGLIRTGDDLPMEVKVVREWWNGLKKAVEIECSVPAQPDTLSGSNPPHSDSDS